MSSAKWQPFCLDLNVLTSLSTHVSICVMLIKCHLKSINKGTIFKSMAVSDDGTSHMIRNLADKIVSVMSSLMAWGLLRPELYTQ